MCLEGLEGAIRLKPRKSECCSLAIQEVEEPAALSTYLHARSPQDSLEAVLATAIRGHECLLGNSTQSTGVQISQHPYRKLAATYTCDAWCYLTAILVLHSGREPMLRGQGEEGSSTYTGERKMRETKQS